MGVAKMGGCGRGKSGCACFCLVDIIELNWCNYVAVKCLGHPE